MPDKVIGVFGGREYSLGDKQKMIFKAGANSILIGNYLTVKGNTVEKDLQMLAELRLDPVSDVKRKK
jgi:biotin synthase